MAFFASKTIVDYDSPEWPFTSQIKAFTHNHESGDLAPHRHLFGGVSRYLNYRTCWGVVRGDHIHEEGNA